MIDYLIVDQNLITVENLESASAQEVFDQAANYMLANLPLFTRKRLAKYRFRIKEVKVSCVAGLFLSNDDYENCFTPCIDDDFEIGCIDWLTLVNERDFTDKHQKLIYHLQIIFDEVATYKWTEALADLAKKHQLKFRME